MLGRLANSSLRTPWTRSRRCPRRIGWTARPTWRTTTRAVAAYLGPACRAAQEAGGSCGREEGGGRQEARFAARGRLTRLAPSYGHRRCIPRGCSADCVPGNRVPTPTVPVQVTEVSTDPAATARTTWPSRSPPPTPTPWARMSNGSPR
ncbi:hypothetical protein LT493_29660 [Streptomyces tricolor]|nr:hypothetical protein [Streptomyces tricolor]